MWGGVLCARIVAAVSAVIAFVVYYYLRGIFRDYDKTEKKNLFLLPVMFLPVVLSLYQISSVSDLTAILLLLAADLCVFGVTTAYIVTRYKWWSISTRWKRGLARSNREVTAGIP